MTFIISFSFVSSDGEAFISADDLRNWKLEITSQSFNIFDVTTDMEDLRY